MVVSTRQLESTASAGSGRSPSKPPSELKSKALPKPDTTPPTDDGTDSWDGDGAQPEDDVVFDDHIVVGSICVGTDCIDGENFGFDTVRLKENNLRFNFEDTSNSASFPSNDWRLEVNDTSNGGLDYFAIADATGGRVPFRVLAGAQDDALVLSSNRAGFGTSAPATELHVVDGDTPTLRLDQDGSSGFSSQIWDLAGNETNFFLRDVSNGSSLVFRVRPGAPTDSISIHSNGDVGMGDDSPEASLHVSRTDETARLLVEERSTIPAERTLLELRNKGSIRIDLADTRLGTTWSLGTTNADEFRISTDGLTQLRLDDDGNLSVPGAMNQLSDVDAKQAFEAVDGASILQKVSQLPLSTWTYRHDDAQSRHIGPMAQDFRAAFGLGTDERHIATMDVNGVTLAAVQELHRVLESEVDSKDARIRELEGQVGDLMARLTALEAALTESNR